MKKPNILRIAEALLKATDIELVECKECRGTGRETNNPKGKCPHCAGQGFQPQPKGDK